MNRAKAIALDALRSPVRRALDTAWACARLQAWRDTSTGRRIFDPDGAVDAMRVGLGALVRSHILEWWEIGVDESSHTTWHLEVKYTYRQNGVRQTGKDRFRLW